MQPTYRQRRHSGTRHGRPSRRPNYSARRALAGAGALALAIAALWLVATASGVVRPGIAAGPDPALRQPAKPAAAAEPARAATTARPARRASRPFTGTVTIAAVGDMMFGRGVADYLRTHSGAAITSAVASRLAAADVTVGNLEGPLAAGGTRAKGKDTTLLGDPRAVAGLSSAGFDAVGLANNHTLDYGRSALASTLRALDDASISHGGAGLDENAAWRPATVVTRSGARVAIISVSHIVPAGFAAQGAHAGIARSHYDMDRVARAIAEARLTHDFVVVSIHWGTEYKRLPSSEQREDAHRAIDAGADLVVGHHPHVIQGIEAYKGRLVAYSLGDFVFDHFSRETGESYILSAQLRSGKPAIVSIVPTYLEPDSGRPSVVHGEAAARILTRLQSISIPLHTKIVIAGDRATVEMPARESQ